MIEGLHRALVRLEEQLTDEVDVDELARTAVTATYHLRQRSVDEDAFTIAGRKHTVPLIYEGVAPYITDLIGSLPDTDR